MKFSFVVIVLAGLTCALAAPSSRSYYYSYGGSYGRKKMEKSSVQVYSAGNSPKPSKMLSSTRMNYICPKDYPTGFTLVCVLPGSPKWVRFFLNDKLVKTEYVAPYTIGGDNVNTGRFGAWYGYGRWEGARIVKCASASDNYTVKFMIKCDAVVPTPEADDMDLED